MTSYVTERHVALAHEKKKSFKCKICDHCSSTQNNLKQHVMLVHDNRKTIKCDICDYTFSLMGTLKRHITSVHEKKKKSFKCVAIAALKNLT